MIATITENDAILVLACIVATMSDAVALTVLLWAMWVGRHDNEMVVL